MATGDWGHSGPSELRKIVVLYVLWDNFGGSFFKKFQLDIL